MYREMGKVLLYGVKWLSICHFFRNLTKDFNFSTLSLGVITADFSYMKLDKRGLLETLTLDELHIYGLFSSFLGRMMVKPRRIQDNSYNL